MDRVRDEIYLAVVALRLRKARAVASLGQEDVADLAGITPRHYRRLEALTSRTANPTLSVLRAVAAAIDTDVPSLTAEPSQAEVEELTKGG